MVKLRNAYYCNLKLFLIGLVVWGHWIEPGIWRDSETMAVYRWIYLVHMPLFAFLSGLFVRAPDGCLRQLRRTVPLYVCAQAIAVLLGGGSVRWDTPFWHLWYLLSLSFWLVFGWLWLRFGRREWRWAALALTSGVSLAVGFVPWIGRLWSLSRTAVFFPWFFLGLLLEPDFPWHRLRLPSLGALAAAVWMVGRHSIPVTFLYQAAPYTAPAQFLLRLECGLIALLLGVFLLAWCPRRRFFFTKAGADTMPVYLLHGFLMGGLRELPLPCPLLWSVGLIAIIFQLGRWHSKPCGIIPGGRREPPWPDSGKSMNSTARPSTGSSWR